MEYWSTIADRAVGELTIGSHDTRLPSLIADDPDIRVAFTFRNPAERFVSAFYSRLQCGRPRNNSPWSTEEAISFQFFKTPDDLARALSGDDGRLFSAAQFAMQAISHLRRDYRFHFGDLDSLVAARKNISFACDISELDNRLRGLFEPLMSSPDDYLPSMGHAHVGTYEDGLSAAGLTALRAYWRDEFDIYDWLCTVFNKTLSTTDIKHLAKTRTAILAARAAGDHIKVKSLFDSCRHPWRLDNSSLYSVGASLFALDPRSDEALTFWQKARRWQRISEDWTHLYLGRCLEHHHRLEEARDAFEKACQATPESPTALFHLLSVQEAMGALDDANALIAKIKDPALRAYCRPVINKVQIASLEFESEIETVKREVAAQPDHLGLRCRLLRTVAASRDFKTLLDMVTPGDLQDHVVLASYWEALLLYRKDADAASALREQHNLSSIDSTLRHKLGVHTDRLALEIEAAKPTIEPANIVEILGSSFCGSTILSMILGNVSGVANVGESHRIIKPAHAPLGLSKLEYYDFKAKSTQAFAPENCFICGPKCHSLPNKFRAELVQDPTRYLEKLRVKIGAKTLVAADKTQHWEVDPLARYNAIVLFKSPTDMLASFVKRRQANPNLAHFQLTERQILGAWYKIYSDFLHNVSPTGQKLFLSYDSLARDPSGTVTALCQKLGLSTSNLSITDIDPKQHIFGGNPALLQRGDFKFTAPQPTPSNSTDPVMPKAVTDLFNAMLAQEIKWLSDSPEVKQAKAV